ncbi:MAG: hypothetical protein AAGA85_16760 [Bacteroidota bacterium]
MSTSEASLFGIEKVDDYQVRGVSSDTLYTRSAWHFQSSTALRLATEDNRFRFALGPGEEAAFYFSFVTHWESEEYVQKSERIILDAGNLGSVTNDHAAIWRSDWAATPLLALPDKEHEKLFYQSVFWLFCTASSEQFLPGESQFAATCWNMRPFTYGAAGWATLAFMHLGHLEKAKTMLLNHYKPEGLRQNTQLYNSEAEQGDRPLSFAHEVRTDGTTTEINDEQRHLNGFALSLFHKYYILSGDEDFLASYLYPVAKGVAEFWCDLARWDDEVDGYVFPELRSLSEDLLEESLLDIVLSAKWSLETAVHYSTELKKDAALNSRWAEVNQKMHIPQNDDHYLEYLNDKEERSYASYQGVRAPVYLGYPTNELVAALDNDKARNTLAHSWKRNHEGEGMLGFIASWYALAAQSYGMGDLAEEMAAQNFNCFDPSHTAICEGPNNLDRYYFLTNTASYLLFPLNMFVQSYENEIVSLPAVPSAWKDVEFYNIPASNNHKVSGEIRDGQTLWYKVEKDNATVVEATERQTISLD